jgi:hypothetical protein
MTLPAHNLDLLIEGPSPLILALIENGMENADVA